MLLTTASLFLRNKLMIKHQLNLNQNTNFFFHEYKIFTDVFFRSKYIKPLVKPLRCYLHQMDNIARLALASHIRLFSRLCNCNYTLYEVGDEITYPFSKHQRSMRWGLGMDTCDYLPMLELKLIHVRKNGPSLRQAFPNNLINVWKQIRSLRGNTAFINHNYVYPCVYIVQINLLTYEVPLNVLSLLAF